MKRNIPFISILFPALVGVLPYVFFSVLIPALVFFLTGCADQLLPAEENAGTNNPTFTLKGDVILEEPLPADAKVVLVWGVTSGSPDYAYVFGKGTIDRAKNTFEIALNEAPPISAVNWFSRGQYDTGFGVATIAVVPESVPEGRIIDNSNEVFGTIYGMVDYSNLIYFSVDPEFWWMSDPQGCHDWTKEFDAGYRFGVGVPAANGCTFDGFKAASPGGLKLIINTDRDRFAPVNWT